MTDIRECIRPKELRQKTKTTSTHWHYNIDNPDNPSDDILKHDMHRDQVKMAQPNLKFLFTNSMHRDQVKMAQPNLKLSFHQFKMSQLSEQC